MNKQKGSLNGYRLCCSLGPMCLGKGLTSSRCFCFEVWTLCSGGSDLLSTGSTTRPVSCFEPGSGLTGQTHQLASFKPQEVASEEKKNV